MIYFFKPITMKGPIKIGYSSNPAWRLYEYCLWSPFPLEIMTVIPGERVLEDKLHSHFFDAHLHQEWFTATRELVSGIKKLNKGVPVEKVFDFSKPHRSLRSKKIKFNKSLTQEDMANGAIVSWPR